MAQESTSIGRTLRNTADRQSRAAIQAAPHSALPPRESLQPPPGKDKRGRKSRLQVPSSAAPSHLDTQSTSQQAQPSIGHSQRNQWQSESPQDQSDTNRNKQMRFSKSNHSRMQAAPPVPPSQSNLVPHRAASVGSGDMVIGSRQDRLDRPAIQSVPPASSLVAGSPIEVPQTSPISAPLPTSDTFTINPRPPLANFHFQLNAPLSVQLLSTSTIHIIQPDPLQMNNSRAPAKDSAGTPTPAKSIPLAQIQSEVAQATSTAQNNSGNNRGYPALPDK